MNFDLLIRNGNVLDGTGAEAVCTDIGITGERIKAIGDLSQAEAKTVIDAGGQIVCPGFIDVHSHSDAYLLIDPRASSKVFQGITTEVCGNCGASAAPQLGEAKLPSDWQDKPFPGTWSTVAEYRTLFELHVLGLPKSGDRTASSVCPVRSHHPSLNLREEQQHEMVYPSVFLSVFPTPV